MMQPNSQLVAHISRETGVCQPCILLKNIIRERVAVPADSSNPENWSGKDKMAVSLRLLRWMIGAFEYCRRVLYRLVARWKRWQWVVTMPQSVSLRQSVVNYTAQGSTKTGGTEAQKKTLAKAPHWFSKKARPSGERRERLLFLKTVRCRLTNNEVGRCRSTPTQGMGELRLTPVLSATVGAV